MHATKFSEGSSTFVLGWKANMEIESIDAVPIAIPLAKPISSSLGTYTHASGVVVTVHTVDGPDGFGFNLGLGGMPGRALAAYIEDELAPLASGQDPLDPEALWLRLWAPNKARLRAGLGAWALSAIDVATWDIAGKNAGVSVHSLLGGFRDRVPAYGSGGWLSLSDTQMLAEAQSFAAQGIHGYKYKIGTPRDEERTALLRAEMGDGFILYADANQRFDVSEALASASMLAEYGVAWLEEPVLADSVLDLAAVATASPVPIAAGENAYFRWGFREICEQNGAAYLQPDVVRCGGFTEFRAIASLAETHSLALTSHLWHELSVSAVAASPVGTMVEYAQLIPPDIFTSDFSPTDGEITVPDVPGHGVEISPEAIARFRV